MRVRNNKLLSLYFRAEAEGIDVDWFPMEVADSLSISLPDGSCCIAIDPWKMDTVAKETVCLAHEMGHCETGAFYNRWASYDLRAKHENRANKWAVEYLVPESELLDAVKKGYSEPWEIAEYFDLPESFIRMAISHYCE